MRELYPIELPLPPAGKSDWPWTEPDQSLLPRRSDGRDWPRISIITPTYKRAEFLEQAIRSVLLQGYPNLQYIVIDGGSTDGSVDIIKKYEPWIAYWVSESDRGQSHALNKGLNHADGELLAWINSDDFYQPGALYAIAEAYVGDPSLGLIFGDARSLDICGNVTGKPNSPTQLDYPTLLKNWGPTWILQPTSFFSKKAWQQCGPIDESLHYAMDMDLILKIAKAGFQLKRIDTLIAHVISHPDAKTTAMREYLVVENAFILLSRHGELAETSAMFYLKDCLADPLIKARGIIRKITDHPIYNFFAPVYRAFKKA